MKPFRVLAKNHTAEAAQKLLELAVEYGANWFDYINGFECYASSVAFGVDYDKCEEFGVDPDGETFAESASRWHNLSGTPLLTYEQAEAHIKASVK